MSARGTSLSTSSAGFAPLSSLRTIALLFVLSVPVWGFETGLFFLIGFSFDFHHIYDNLWQLAAAMVLVTALANIGSSVPSSPGGIGLFELIARETLVLLPLAVVDRSEAAAFAAVSHFALLLPMIILGAGVPVGREPVAETADKGGYERPPRSIG